MYQCKDCDNLMRSYWGSWYWTTTLACPRCGREELQKLAQRDRIDKMSNSPISVAQHWFGAPLYYCALCRFQFYDFRHRRKRSKAAE